MPWALPALHLPFNVARMDRLSGVDDGREPVDGDLARLGVHLDVDDAAAERDTFRRRCHAARPDDGAARIVELASQLREAHAELRVGFRYEVSPFQVKRVGIDLPYPCRPLDHLALDVSGPPHRPPSRS